MDNKLLYAVLFLKGRNGTNIKELSKLLNVKPAVIMQGLNDLEAELIKTNWPLEIRQNEERVRLTVSKETSMKLSETMNKTINVSLTKSVLEALTIIAYKQPTTKSDIEKIRGVSADYSISKLLEYELIESNERADLPGRPRLYVTTSTFLELFDLNSLNDLPEASQEFEEKTQETTLFTYESDDEEQEEAKKQALEEAKLLEGQGE